MSRLEDVILRGTRAAQPAAIAVATGTIYFVTGENVLERSSGTVWESISAAVAGSIGGNGLSGGFILSLVNEEPEYPINIPGSRGLSGDRGLDGLRGIPGIDGEDGETLLIPGIQGPVGPAGAAGGGSSSWDATVTKTGDQSVTNSATLVNDTELKITGIVSGGVYLIEFSIVYSANDVSADFAWQFAVPISANGQAQGYWSGFDVASASTFVNAIGNLGQVAWPVSTAGVAGVPAVNGVYVLHGRFTFTSNGTTDVQFKFANVSAGGGRTSTCKTGSLLKYKRLA